MGPIGVSGDFADALFRGGHDGLSLSDGRVAQARRDLARQLYPPTENDPAERRRIASKVSYWLRILRAHGLIRKSPGQRRYHMTTKGREITTALSRSQDITLQQLNAIAA